MLVTAINHAKLYKKTELHNQKGSFYVIYTLKNIKMKTRKAIYILIALFVLMTNAACEHIDNKSIPNFAVRIDLGNYALWNTYGVNGMGDFRIFNREKKLPANFPYNVNTFTGYGGVLLMMGMEVPMAYDLSCPVEVSQDIILSISPDNFEAICPRCNSHFDPLMGDGGPVSGVAINNKVGMRKYRVLASNGGYIITN